MAKTETKPVTDDVISQWPPVAHIVRKGDSPPRALCGEKLMGERVDGNVLKSNCKKCLEIMKKELTNG